MVRRGHLGRERRARGRRRVLIREGHAITYDVKSDAVIRAINVAGTLAFASDKDTVLNVGLIKIQPGEEYSEDGFDCDGHMTKPKPASRCRRCSSARRTRRSRRPRRSACTTSKG